MNHEGKAGRAAAKVVFWATSPVALLFLVRLAGFWRAPSLLLWIVAALWALFILFTLYFFRDPKARPAAGSGILLAPGHGKVDVIDETEEPSVMGGRCRRVSIFLSVFDVHVQQAPVSGRIIFFQHTPGKFLNAISADCALHNENVLLGFELEEAPGVHVGVRLVAGLIARRIVPWVAAGETVERGQRISLIQFGSRCDLYFPLHYKVRVALGDRVTGGETVVAAAA
jgi:phosphatidylserine decarboxylase